MFEISIKTDFSSAHNLREYYGKCESLHGHNWKVEVKVCSKGLDKIGMVMDFKKLKEALEDIIKELDHKYLNNLKYFKKINPTSENIAEFIFNQLSKSLAKQDKNVTLKSVTVWENDNSFATYVK